MYFDLAAFIVPVFSLHVLTVMVSNENRRCNCLFSSLSVIVHRKASCDIDNNSAEQNKSRELSGYVLEFVR